MKSILVLGGVDQLSDAVAAARTRGYRTIVTDNVVTSPAKRVAHVAANVSVTDVNGLVRLAAQHKVAGVINYCLHPAQLPYLKVAERLKLPHYGNQQIFNALTQKVLFRTTARASRLSVPIGIHWKPGAGQKEPLKLLREHGNLVVKPSDGRASKGLEFVNDAAILPAALERAAALSSDGQAVLEERIDGPEIAIKYFVQSGKVFLVSVADLYTQFWNGQRVYLVLQRFPSRLLAEFRANCDSTARKYIRALGVTDGPISLTARYRRGRFYFIDPSHRLGGAADWQLVAAHTGVNLADHLTQFSVTGKFHIPGLRDVENGVHLHHGAVAYILVRPGRTHQVTGLDRVLAINNVVNYHFSQSLGSEVQSFGTTENVILRILVADSSEAGVASTLDAIDAQVDVLDENGNSLAVPPNLGAHFRTSSVL